LIRILAFPASWRFRRPGVSAIMPPMETGGRPRASLGAPLMLALSLGVLALAINHALFNWVLFTDALIRRLLF
jgi:hypothetical protein